MTDELTDEQCLEIPEFSLVVLVGASGAGKSTFAQRHFIPTEVVSSDHFRAVVSDDETDQSATSDAFEVLNTIVDKRLGRRKLTVVDATNVEHKARQPLLHLARVNHALPVAIVLDLPVDLCAERNAGRQNRPFGRDVVASHVHNLRRSLKHLRKEGFRVVHVLSSVREIESARITRRPLWCDKRDETGPFDIIGDVHGCLEELRELMARLGYQVDESRAEDGGRRFSVIPPKGRRIVFVGDLVDRGPDSPGVLRLAMDMVRDGVALCVPGNHDAKLGRKLAGRKVKVAHGLAETLEQLETEPEGFREEAREFLEGLVSHLVLDGGRLVVAHAGLREDLQNRASGRVRSFALYGDTSGEKDEYGLPIRKDWAADYGGDAMVVYGHTPKADAWWVNNTICIDTACVFGGELTALRYPERELVSVPAHRTYYQPPRPIEGTATAIRELARTPLEAGPLLGERRVETRLAGPVKIKEQNASAALEVLSRWTIDPRWLITLPPTMSPVDSSSRDGWLERPEEAFDYFRSQGLQRVICQEKHMGSRAMVVVCRDQTVATDRFGVTGLDIPGQPDAVPTGAIFTRTGRPFFSDPAWESALLDIVRGAAEQAGLFDELETGWLCLDCELMPWSAKASSLVEQQYQPVGQAARMEASAVISALTGALERGLEVGELLETARSRVRNVEAYNRTWRAFCWPTSGVEDLKLAPFHLLASEGAVHVDKDHRWHLRRCHQLADCAGGIVATRYRDVELSDAEAIGDCTMWWESLTASGGEGMVVKPLPFLVQQKRLVQPALKVRGRDYLRIIYGPDYTLPTNLKRLRTRRVGHKRSLARRELALGVEALERFVRFQPPSRVHDCVAAILALECEPVDPRL